MYLHYLATGAKNNYGALRREGDRPHVRILLLGWDLSMPISCVENFRGKVSASRGKERCLWVPKLLIPKWDLGVVVYLGPISGPKAMSKDIGWEPTKFRPVLQKCGGAKKLYPLYSRGF